MKAHDHRVLLTNLLEYILHSGSGSAGDRVIENSDALACYSEMQMIIRKLVQSDHRHTDMELVELDRSIPVLLRRMEGCFPISLKVISFHIIEHSPRDIRNWGNSAGFAAWGSERMQHEFSKTIHSTVRPEKQVISTLCFDLILLIAVFLLRVLFCDSPVVFNKHTFRTNCMQVVRTHCMKTVVNLALEAIKDSVTAAAAMQPEYTTPLKVLLSNERYGFFYCNSS